MKNNKVKKYQLLAYKNRDLMIVSERAAGYIDFEGVNGVAIDTGEKTKDGKTVIKLNDGRRTILECFTYQELSDDSPLPDRYKSLEKARLESELHNRPTYGEVCIILGVIFELRLQTIESKIYPGSTKLNSAILFWAQSSTYAVGGARDMYVTGTFWENIKDDFPQFERRLQQLRASNKTLS